MWNSGLVERISDNLETDGRVQRSYVLLCMQDDGFAPPAIQGNPEQRGRKALSAVVLTHGHASDGTLGAEL